MHIAAADPLAALNAGALLAAERTAPLGRIGSLEVRLARNAGEIEAAQAMRYRIFFGEHGATALDIDSFDTVCDHLLVFDTAMPGPDHRRIVGTYRLLPQEKAAAAGGFYSASEFEIGALVARHPGLRFLELGRSCVLPAYRSKRTITLLWQGIWAYVQRYRFDVMTGCASFPGRAPEAHAQALSFLAHHCRAAGEWDVRAVHSRYRSMDLMPAEAVDMRAALADMPPLIKGYLRVGARVGDGCVVDREFGSVDVCIVMPIRQIATRYVNYYGADAERFAA